MLWRVDAATHETPCAVAGKPRAAATEKTSPRRLMTSPPILTASFIQIHGQGAGKLRTGLEILMLERLSCSGNTTIQRAIRRPDRQIHSVRITLEHKIDSSGACPVRQPQTQTA